MHKEDKRRFAIESSLSSSVLSMFSVVRKKI